VSVAAQSSDPTAGEPGGHQPGLDMQDVVCGSQQTLRLSGELDLVSAPMLDGALRRVCAADLAAVVVLDLGGVTFMDSSGLRSIMTAKEVCTKAGVELRVLPGQAQVQRLFEITGVHDLLSGTSSHVGPDRRAPGNGP
jgi:anti-anti-sigma factor